MYIYVYIYTYLCTCKCMPPSVMMCMVVCIYAFPFHTSMHTHTHMLRLWQRNAVEERRQQSATLLLSLRSSAAAMRASLLVWHAVSAGRGQQRRDLATFQGVCTHICSVLRCVAVCCSALQCIAVCCSVLQSAAVFCSVLQCAAECCSVLQQKRDQPRCVCTHVKTCHLIHHLNHKISFFLITDTRDVFISLVSGSYSFNTCKQAMKYSTKIRCQGVCAHMS